MTSMNPEQLIGEIDALLPNVTAGPWIRSGYGYNVIGEGGEGFAVSERRPQDGYDPVPDARYIALCNPENMRALIAAYRAMEGRTAEIAEGKDRVQGMVRSIDQYRNADPKAILAGSNAQILHALTDAKTDVLALWCFAVSVANRAEKAEAERDELAKACRARRKQYGEGHCDEKDGSCCECEHDMAVALRVPKPIRGIHG